MIEKTLQLFSRCPQGRRAGGGQQAEKGRHGGSHTDIAPIQTMDRSQGQGEQDSPQPGSFPDLSFQCPQPSDGEAKKTRVPQAHCPP